MGAYRKGSHSVYLLPYHFVFVPKYCKPELVGEVGLRVRELIREIGKSHDVEIIKGHVRPDHVHLLLSMPPAWSLGDFSRQPNPSDFRRRRIQSNPPYSSQLQNGSGENVRLPE